MALAGARTPEPVSLAEVFQDPVSYPLDRPARSLSVADLDGDGRNDLLVVTDPNSSAIGVLRNLGEAGFDSPRYTELQDTWLRTRWGMWTATALRICPREQQRGCIPAPEPERRHLRGPALPAQRHVPERGPAGRR